MLTASEFTAVENMKSVLRQPVWMRERATERLALAMRLCGADQERAERLARTALIDVAMGGTDAARAHPRRKK